MRTNKGGIMVTGASGVIGNALVEELEANGRRPVVAVSSRDADLTDFAATIALFERHRP